ncbi:MAG: Ig-like domain-containing protein [Bacteroidaceae bacterium]|nr:Ig-like domain-containing protein [Bacteroidaceae bacterium]
MKLKTFLVAAIAAMVSLGVSAWDGSGGKVYLQNVGSGLWWGAGNSWGTQASLLQHPEYVTLHLSDGKYTLESQVSNGGTAYYFNGSYMDNSSPVNLTITASGDYYTIANGDTYYGYDGSSTVLGAGIDATTDNGKWRIFTEAEMLANLENATEENPIDATFLILDPNFGRNNRNVGSWTMTASNQNLSGGNNINNCAESYHSTFTLSQAIANAPYGYYGLKGQGFYRQDGSDNTHLPYFYFNNEKVYFPLKTGTENSMSEASVSFTNGLYKTSELRVTHAGGSLTIGAKLESNTALWCIWDNFELMYYGPIDLSEFEAQLAAKVQEAEAVASTIPTACYNNIAAAITTYNKAYATADEYATAINAIDDAIIANTQADIVSAYAGFKTIRAAVLAINNGIDVSAANTAAEAATTVAALETATANVRTALKTYLASVENEEIDLTVALLINPGFELGNITGWTNSGVQAAGAQGNMAFDNTQGSYYAERWHQNGTVDLNQTITDMPVGYYRLSAYIYCEPADGLLYANSANTSVSSSKLYSVPFNLTETGDIKIGASCTLTSSTWFCMDGFKLEFLGTAPLSIYQQQLADAVTAANTHADAIPIPAGFKSIYTAAISTAAAKNTSIDECLQSIADIESATAAADVAVAPYAAYQTAVANATFVGVASETITAQNAAVAEATTVDGITACTTALTTAIDAVESHNITAYTIKNPTAQTKDNWEGTDFGGQSDNVCEYWNKSGADFHQTINLPVGKYCLTVIALQRTGMTGTVYAGENRTTIVQVSKDAVNNRAAASTWFNAGNGVNHVYFEVTGEAKDVVIGLTADATTGDHWTVWKSFALSTFDESVAASYLKPGYDDAMAAAVAYQTVDMFDADKTALNTAISDNTVEEASATIAAYETAIANLNAAAAAAATAVANYTQYNAVVAAIGENTNVDLTSFVANGDFELNNLSGWTSVDGGNVANNGNFNSTYFVERWKNGVALGSGSLTHDAIVLPAGVYRITADAQNIEQYNSNAGGDGLYLCANEEQTEIHAKGNYAVYVKVADKTPLTIKFLQDNCTGNWIAYDNVTLTYVAADYVYAAVEGKMNATVATAQTAAVEAFEAAQTAANYKALVAAIAAAQASKDAYTAAAAALTKANDILNSTNVYTAEARTAYADAIATAQTAYDDNSMTTEAANGFAASVRDFARAFVVGAWTATNDVNVYTNDWSVEGDAEGASGMTTPFIEDYVADASKLANTEISATLSDLENGLYSVTAFVRVFNNKEGDDAGYDGISLAVNDGTPVAFADATQYTDGYAKEITAEGLVKGGILTIKVAVENTNASWLAFKNVNYTKVRDLTDEEQAVAPTAIALYNGEEEVTENIILNGSETTVTLTTSLTPAEATPGFIEWESSDESVATVANGVVKANGTGTTTITAKSTIDPTITATATVVAYAFKNQSFEADGNQAAGNSTNPNMITITGWTQEQNTAGSFQDNQLRDASTDNASNYGKRVTPSNGSYYFFYRHGWNGSNYAKLTSEAQNLPIGKYTLTVDYKMVAGSDNTSNNDNTAITLSAISGETTLATTTKNDATKANNNSSTAYLVNEGWKTVSTSFTIEEETSVQAVINLLACGPKRSDFVVDNVTLTWSSFKDALKDAIDVAEAVDVTTNVGEAVFQIPASAVSTFTSAISDAQGVYDNAESTESNYLDAIKALNNAKAAYADPILNAPDAEQLYNIVVATADHAKENNPIIIIPGATSANNPTGYALNANFETNINLSQAFTFTQVEGNTYKISAKVAGVDVYLTNGTLNGSAAGWSDSQIQATTDAEKAMAFKIAASSTEGSFNIYNATTKSTIACQNGGNIYTEAGNADFALAEVSKPSITINTTAAGWGTVMLPFAVAELPEGVKAYTVSGLEGKNNDKLTLDEAETLEANKPYIIEGAWNETLDGDAQGTALTYTDGLLTGVYASQLAPVGSYVLQKNYVEEKDDYVVGFYQVAKDKQPTVGANRAYLTVPEAAGVKAFFFDSTATAIQNVMSGAAAGEIYDLSGRKVSKMQRGNTYIVNGQKVMIK